MIPSPAGGSGAWAGPNARGAAARARRPPYAVLGQAGGRQAKHRHPAGQAKHAPGRAGQHRQAGAAAEGVHAHARSRSVPRGVFFFLGPPISVSLAHCTPARHAGGKQARHHRAEAKPASRHAGRRAAGTQGVQSERRHPVWVFSDLGYPSAWECSRKKKLKCTASGRNATIRRYGPFRAYSKEGSLDPTTPVFPTVWN